MHSASRTAVAPLLRKALSSSKILSADRERQLLMQYQADGSKAAMDELVRSHMPIIFRVAGRSAQNPGVDINDLIQTATEGLLIAINRWSFEKSDASVAPAAIAAPVVVEAELDEPAEPVVQTGHSSRLATYALWWMRIMLTNSVIDNRGVVVRAKNPKVRKALFALPAAIKKLEISLPLSSNDVKRISTYLGIGEQYIEEALVHAAGDVMLDEPVGDGSVLRGDVIPDNKAESEVGIISRLTSEDSWDAICEALLELSPRDRFILITRYLLNTKWKLDRLSDTLKMSRERIRQIACDGLARIRANVGPNGVSHNPSRRRAGETIEALVKQVEAASESSDPSAIAVLLRTQHIITGPTRILNRSAAAPAKQAETETKVPEWVSPLCDPAFLPVMEGAMQDAAD
jgi:RNA polymerase sigma-32 factor